MCSITHIIKILLAIAGFHKSTLAIAQVVANPLTVH